MPECLGCASRRAFSVSVLIEVGGGGGSDGGSELGEEVGFGD